MATGGGFATRELFSDDEEKIFDAKRPILLNGINEVAERSDLIDRSITVSLPTIPESNRRAEAGLWCDFDEARPRILGALLSAVVLALRRLPSVRLDRLPRMADFALWVTAGEPGLGLTEGTFMAAYTGNREAGNQNAIEGSVIGPTLMTWVETLNVWTGSATELLGELDGVAGERTKKQQGWPRNGKSVSAALKRLAPNLRAMGVDVRFIRQPGGTRTRIFEVEKTPDFASRASLSSRNPDSVAETEVSRDASGTERDGSGTQPVRANVAEQCRVMRWRA